MARAMSKLMSNSADTPRVYMTRTRTMNVCWLLVLCMYSHDSSGSVFALMLDFTYCSRIIPFLSALLLAYTFSLIGSNSSLTALHWVDSMMHRRSRYARERAAISEFQVS